MLFLNSAKEKNQPFDEVVDVSDWVIDDYAGIYPKGARDKYALFCPSDTKYNFLIRDKTGKYLHRYLYKLSFKRYPEQFWIEIAAYRIGKIVKVNVPPAFVAINSKENTCGALIEWFFVEYPRSRKQGYKDGGQIMKKWIPDFDSKKGTQHNFQTIIKEIPHSWISVWAKYFLFDALIGNTDRHQENWGIISKIDGKSRKEWLAPAFDNGTSMGHEIMENNFKKYENADYLDKYIKNGLSHMKWDVVDTSRLNLLEYLEKFVSFYPKERRSLVKCINFPIDEVENAIMDLTKYKVYIPLSENRAKFMIKLISKRQEMIKDILGK